MSELELRRDGLAKPVERMLTAVEVIANANRPSTMAAPDTVLRWYPDLVAKKYEGAKQRRPGRPRKGEELKATCEAPLPNTSSTLSWRGRLEG